jgi:hypothetical protein
MGIPQVANFRTSIIIIILHTVRPYHELRPISSDIYSMENLIVHEEKFFSFETNLRERENENGLRIKVAEYMFKFLMFVNVLLFWQLQCR